MPFKNDLVYLGKKSWRQRNLIGCLEDWELDKTYKSQNGVYIIQGVFYREKWKVMLDIFVLPKPQWNIECHMYKHYKIF